MEDVFPDASFQCKVVTHVDVFVGLSTFFYTQYYTFIIIVMHIPLVTTRC